MNQKLMRLLSAALCVSSAAMAASETNRPYIAVRDFRNRAEAMTTIHKSIAVKSSDRIGAHMELVPFYAKTRDSSKDELGKGFGVLNKNTFKLASSASALDLDAGYFLHDYTHGTDNPATATVTLSPEQKAYGINFHYIHELEEVSEGLFFRIDTGLMKVEHLLNSAFTGLVVPTGGTINFQTYLDGSTAGAVTHNLQAKLEKGKINNEKRDDAGFNDVELMLGWKFVNKDNARLALNIAGLIPTGNEPTAEWLFEPLYGTRHFQAGVGLSGEAVLWENEDSCFKIGFDGQYRYGFEREVKRLVGIKGLTSANDWGFYNLLQKKDAVATTSLVPAANVLAMDLKVTPGSLFDGYIMASLCAKAFVGDFGYNIYATRAQKPIAKDWANSTYWRVAKTFDTSGAFDATAQAAGLEITKDKLDKDVDGQIIHRIFGSIGACTTDWDYPVTLGIGGSIEFVQGTRKQITPENWEIFGKAGISF